MNCIICGKEILTKDDLYYVNKQPVCESCFLSREQNEASKNEEKGQLLEENSCHGCCPDCPKGEFFVK